MSFLIDTADPRAPGPAGLLAQSHALMDRLFPPEDNHYLAPEALVAPHITFLAALDGAATIGTVALSELPDGTGELKSLFVAETARGRGVAEALLREVERRARARGLTALRLETGDLLHAAVRLYERHGFARCGPFGGYDATPTSVFMEKPLGM